MVGALHLLHHAADGARIERMAQHHQVLLMGKKCRPGCADGEQAGRRGQAVAARIARHKNQQQERRSADQHDEVGLKTQREIGRDADGKEAGEEKEVPMPLGLPPFRHLLDA